MKNTVRVHGFHGGIHPPENKKQSTGAPISLAPLPTRIVLPLQQHIGLPADPVVNVGDRVLKGQKVAEAIGRISANIHSSISGTVVAIESHPVPHMSGMEAGCLIIESDGKDEWIEHQGLEDYTRLPKPALIEYIRQAGVAGMGGAGFPTDVKLHLGDDHIVNTLIINAAECEPYITADDMLMRERADEILGGIEIIAHLLQPLHIMVGIEDNKPQAIRALHAALDNSPLNLDIVITPTKYPSGGEKQLIKLLTDVEVPSGKIPADVGIVCQNIGTTTAIYRAVAYGEPLISRVVTVTGQAAGHKQNYEVRIGTRFCDLLDHAEVRREQMHRLIVGGPMMGITVINEQIPVIKTTNCLIAGSIEEMPPQPPAQACIRCGMCEQVCPVELLPQQLHWFAKGKEFEKARHHNLFDCIECGACSYVCPSNIPLVQYYRFAKAEIRKEDAEQRKADHARIRFEARLERLERDKIEKEERRKQRAIEAAAAQAAKKDAALKTSAAPTAASAANAATADLKQLKSNAAIARTKLKKAEKALANAQDKGLDGIETLQATLQQLQVKADQAEQAYAEAQNTPAQNQVAPETDLKQLKNNAAIARTKLKKAEKLLAAAEESGDADIDALKAQVAALQKKTDHAEKAYKDADSGAAAAVDTSELEADIAAMQAKVDKAEGAWKAAVESDSPAAAKMAAGVEKLRDKLTALQDELAKARSLPASSVSTAATINTAELEADISAMQGKVDKAEGAWKTAVESGSPAADKMAAGVAKLKDKLQALQDELAQANGRSTEQPATEAETPPVTDLKTLKQQVSIMRTKLKKAEKMLAELPEGEEDPALVADIEALTLRHDAAKAILDAAEAEKAAAAAAQGIDLKQLKIDAAMARAAVTKAERALSKAEDDSKQSLEDELLAAQAQADKLNSTLERFSE